MTRSPLYFSVLVAGLACGPPAPPGSSKQPTGQRDSATALTGVCARPPRGIIVGLDTVAGFPTNATFGRLRQQCAAGKSELYDAVGWQAAAWTFPFAGAQVMAVQTKDEVGQTIQDNEIPDLWTVEGDSVRMPDGQLVPRTLGVLRSRYGFATVDDNIRGDDFDGPSARSCRFPYLVFALSTADTARRVPDSARVTRVDMTRGDTAMARYCMAHQPVSER